MNLTKNARWLFTSLATLSIVIAQSAASVAAQPAIDLLPASATFAVLPGGSVTETKTIHLPAKPKPSKVDIEIAIDTTGSMGPSIAQAKADAINIVTGVQASVPDTQFAVVAFKDFFDTTNPPPQNYEYQVLQPMTADATAVQLAINPLTDYGGFDPPEAYNLIFHNSFTPAVGGDIGWRSDSRKFVIVIGDAQPHGDVLSQGFSGCQNWVTNPTPPWPASPDPHGLATISELSGMKFYGRTLLMLRQVSQYTTVSLQCYQSLAAAEYTGGAAADANLGGAGTLATQIVNLVNTAIATVGDVHLEVQQPNPYASWITFNPPSRTNVSVPSTQTFNLTVNVPSDAPGGTFNFKINAIVDGVFDGTSQQTLTIVTNPGSIGNFVWNDLNRNGIQDTNELGIPGVTVSLTDGSGNSVKDIFGNTVVPTVTDANGKYLFSNLLPGNYIVLFSKPPGYDFTLQYAQGSDGPNFSRNDKDSNADPITGKSDVVPLAAGQSNLTIDAGMSKVTKSITSKLSSMEGDLHIKTGDWVSIGYNFNAKVSSATTIVVAFRAEVSCAGDSPLLIPGPNNPFARPAISPAPSYYPQPQYPNVLVGNQFVATYNLPAGFSEKLPTGDSNNPRTFAGAIQAPRDCNAARGAMFFVDVSQSTGSPAYDWQFKYRDPNAKGKGNMNCANPTLAAPSGKFDAAQCGASWSATYHDP